MVYARHYTEDVVVRSVYTYLGGLGTFNSSVGENELKSSVVDA